jgi:polyphosphate kinase
MSENISVISIVDKYLEHSRMYIFANGGQPKFFAGSADWMVRNFDQRFEVVAPIYSEQIQKEMMDMINIQLSDNVKARFINVNPNNSYRTTKSKKQVRSQIELYEYFKKKHTL